MKGIHKIDRRVDIICSNSGSICINGNEITKENSLLDASEGQIEIGDNVFINRNVTIVSKELIKIGDNVSIGPNVCIYDHDHDHDMSKSGFVVKPIIIKDEVWLGAGVIVLKGVSIGKVVVVAAGAVVTNDVPEFTMYYAKNKTRKRITSNGINEQKNDGYSYN